MADVTDMIGNVLEQRAAERHVEQLVSPADRQQGQIRLEGGFEQGEFRGVAHRIDRPRRRVQLLAVERRVHIEAANDDEAVKSADHVARADAGSKRRRIGVRQQQRSSSCLEDQLVIGGVEQRDLDVPPRTPARCRTVGRHADEWGAWHSELLVNRRGLALRLAMVRL